MNLLVGKEDLEKVPIDDPLTVGKTWRPCLLMNLAVGKTWRRRLYIYTSPGCRIDLAV